jgi:hypothetical protein
MNNIIKTKNLIKHPAICCVYCGKSYKTRLNLDKHLILCEITYKSKKSKYCDKNDDDDNDYDEAPSQKILYKIILELSLKCNKLETKVNEMSKHITKKIQKINILDYLNSENYSNNNNPTLFFENITDLICVEQCDIEMLFHNSFIHTLIHILSKIISNNTDDNSKVLPIVAFTQKINTIYIYTKSNETITNDVNTQKPSWVIISKDKLVRFLNIIQFKMSKALSEWRKKNIQLLNENDSQSILYDKTFSKLMEPDFKTDTIYNKYYNNIYNKFKTELNFIEYDVSF